MRLRGGSQQSFRSSLRGANRAGATLDRVGSVLHCGAERAASATVVVTMVVAAATSALAGCGAAPASPRRGSEEKLELIDRSGPGAHVRAVAWAEGGALVAMNHHGGGAAEGAAEDVEIAERGELGLLGGWTLALDGAAGPMAASGARAVATSQRRPAEAELLLVETGRGAVTAKVPLVATDYVTLAGAAVCGDGAVVAGSFGGTLRVGERVVSSGGQRDGFAAFVDGRGAVTELLRMGGDHDDGFTAVACRGQDVALAGTFSFGAELRGQELPRLADKTLAADALVVKLSRQGQLAWLRTFGGSKEDLAADVAITEAGDLAVAGMARSELTVGDSTFTVNGVADGYLARWAADGTPRGALLFGGIDYDATTELVALGERLIVGGFFSGSIDLGGMWTARGGDDAMLIVVEPAGAARMIPVGGDGREEIVSLAATAGGGVVMGVSHTAGFVALGLQADLPRDAMGGAAVVIVPAL